MVDPRGKMASLHKFNPVRLGYIRDQAAARFKRDAKQLGCLRVCACSTSAAAAAATSAKCQ